MAKQPIPKATAAADALQPVNIQLAKLIEVCKGLNKAATGVSSVGSKSSSTLGGLSSTLFGIKSATLGAIGSVGLFVGVIRGAFAGLVGAFRPDAVERFDRASKDLFASIGELLLPVFEVAIRVVRFMGDTFAGITVAISGVVNQGLKILEPMLVAVGRAIQQLVGQHLANIMPVVQQVMSVFADLAGIFIENLLPVVLQLLELSSMLTAAALGTVLTVVQALMPLIKFAVGMLTGVLSVITEIATLAGDVFGAIRDAMMELFEPVMDLVREVYAALGGAFKQLTTWIKEFITFVRELLGLPAKQGIDVKGDGQGKGASNVRFSNTDEMYREVAKATFGAGRGKQEDPTLTEMKKTGSNIQLISDNVKAIWDAAGPYIKLAQQALENGKAAVESASPVAQGIGQSTLQFQILDMLRGQNLTRN